jgi:hypothetical protein
MSAALLVVAMAFYMAAVTVTLALALSHVLISRSVHMRIGDFDLW